MDFQPDETQSRIRDLAKIFVRECVTPEAETWEREEHIPENFLKRMAQQGFLGMVVPADYGGSGIDPVGWVLALAEVAAASPTLGLVMS
ncbi:MAG: acyl-CoA dehydrogenase family protein, partial [Nitrospinota bacterium]|nr:acyl-CoA dehydrogenase family protein [Nitrospinota bacterium]